MAKLCFSSFLLVETPDSLWCRLTNCQKSYQYIIQESSYCQSYLKKCSEGQSKNQCQACYLHFKSLCHIEMGLRKRLLTENGLGHGCLSKDGACVGSPWQRYCCFNGCISCNKVSRSYRKERRLPLVLGIYPAPQEAATYLASLSPSCNKTLTVPEQKQNCKDSVQKKFFFCTLHSIQL